MPDKFKEFIESLQLKYFDPEEFLVSVHQPDNEFPPERLWPNLVPTALLLDRVREHYGRPLVITSCYRNPEFNRRVGGAERSNHQAFTAADFGVAGVDPADVAELLRSWRDQWFAAPFRPERVRFETPEHGPVPFASLNWRGCESELEFQLKAGVGRYTRFTHLDTRGLNNTWKGH